MKIKLLLLISVIFLLTGCSNYRELNGLGITSAIGISKENEQYKLTAQILNTHKKEEEGGNFPNYVMFTAYGNTMQEALRNMVKESSNRLYITHLQVLLIDEKLAREGIDDIIDFFLRDTEARKQFLTLIAKDDIGEILNTKTFLKVINGNGIKETLLTNYKYLGGTERITFEELINEYINPYNDIILPSIEIVKEKNIDDEDKTTKRLVLTNSAIFKENKLVEFINDQDSININVIKNNIFNTIYTIKADGYSTVEVIRSKNNININKNNITLNIKLSVELSDINQKINLECIEDKKMLNAMLSSNITNSINKTIEKLVIYDSDVIGFKEMVYKNNSKYFKDNNIQLKDINIKVNTNIKILSQGNGVNNLNG